MRAITDFFRRIRVRLTLWYVFLLAIVLVLFSVVLYLSLQSSLLREVDRGLRNSSAQVASGLDFEDSRRTVKEPENSQDVLTKMVSQGFLVVLSNNKGQVLQSAGPYATVIGGSKVLESGFETVKTPRSDCVSASVAVPVDFSTAVPYVAMIPKTAMRNHENRWARYSRDTAKGISATTAKEVTGVRLRLRNAMKYASPVTVCER